MANQEIFCSVPWHSSHLYWDGSYGACCFEKSHPIGQKHTLSDSSLSDWHNSQTMRNFRLRILGTEKLPECSGCYLEEQLGHESKRIRENYKVAIFTKEAFEKSFIQSPWHKKFNEAVHTGTTDSLPIDLHLDFGNECNLSCKMCHPGSSSKIYQTFKNWNLPVEKINNWTNDEECYKQLLANIGSIKNINRIHVMGGEPMINKRFYQFVSWLLENNYSNISLSFVTNGTIYNESFIQKLKLFRSVDIEVSIESIQSNNHYIRQGSNTDEIISNIKKLINNRSKNFEVVLRTVPQLFSVNNYHELILFALDNKLSVQSTPLTDPQHLDMRLLPYEIKQTFIKNYEQIRDKILQNNSNFKTISVGRDTSRLEQQLALECNTIINLLNSPYPGNVNNLRKELISWIKKWDKIYNLDAVEYFPEYKDFLIKSGY